MESLPEREKPERTNGTNVLKTGVLIGTPLPPNRNGVPANIIRPILGGWEETVRLRREGGAELAGRQIDCRVEILGTIPGWLRRKMDTGHPDTLTPDEFTELDRIMTDPNAITDPDAIVIEKRAKVLAEVCKRVRQQLGLANVSIRSLEDTARDDADDRDALMAFIRGAPGYLSYSLDIEGKQATLAQHLESPPEKRRSFIPDFVKERTPDGRETIRPGDKMYALIQLLRMVRKVEREIRVLVYERESGLIPFVRALLQKFGHTDSTEMAARGLVVSRAIEGFRLKCIKKEEGTDESKLKKPGEELKLKWTAPYILGQGCVPLFPWPTGIRTAEEFHARYFRDDRIAQRYIGLVILPALRRMFTVAVGTSNAQVTDDLFGTTVNRSTVNRSLTERILAPDASPQFIKLHILEALQLFMQAFVRPINERMTEPPNAMVGGPINSVLPPGGPSVKEEDSGEGSSFKKEERGEPESGDGPAKAAAGGGS